MNIYDLHNKLIKKASMKKVAWPIRKDLESILRAFTKTHNNPEVISSFGKSLRKPKSVKPISMEKRLAALKNKPISMEKRLEELRNAFEASKQSQKPNSLDIVQRLNHYNEDMAMRPLVSWADKYTAPSWTHKYIDQLNRTHRNTLQELKNIRLK